MGGLYIRKVLVVTADDALVKLAEVSIRDVGRWLPIVARTVADAERLTLREKPEAILVDVTLADHERIFPSPSAVIMIVNSGDNRAKASQRYLPLGACGIIRKPLNPLELPDQIRDLIGAEEGASPDVLFRGK